MALVLRDSCQKSHPPARLSKADPLLAFSDQEFRPTLQLMKKLREGIIDFRRRVLPSCREKFAKLAEGQNPDVLFITCSDSRVAPNWFASTDPGDLFVVRNVGNLVPPSEAELTAAQIGGTALAAAEFAILRLKVRHIVVCGHSECGAMNALWSDASLDDAPHLKSWLQFGKPALKKLREGVTIDSTLSPVNQLSQLNVLQQLHHLETHPLIAQELAKGNLELHGWWFDIAKADVHAYDEKSQKFKVIE
jgi:carbonic anhydrase